jgi:hypothetical protein
MAPDPNLCLIRIERKEKKHDLENQARILVRKRQHRRLRLRVRSRSTFVLSVCILLIW